VSTSEVTPPSVRWLAVTGVLVTVGALWASDGNLVVAILPAILGVVGVVFFLAPLRISALLLTFACLLFEDTRARPHMGLWQSPLYYPGRFLYDGIEKTLHIPGLKIFGIELLTLLLLTQLVVRIWLRQGSHPPPARPLYAALLVSIATVLLWETWGILRGGILRFSMLQMRPLLYLPTAGLLFAYAFRTAKDLRNILVAFLTVGALRALVGMYFWKVILKDQAHAQLEIGGGHFITSHHDTVLWVTCVVILVAALLIRPGRSTLLFAAAMLPLFGVAIAANNRRLAIIAAAFGFFALYAVVRAEVQSRVHKIIFICLPIFFIYTAAAWNASGMWARPVAVIKSLSAEKQDFSTDMRDIENYNLVKTLRQNPILGSGLGHEYEEQVRGIDISEFLEAYRYLPHNSLLWSMTALGLIGFVLYWSLFLVMTFLAVRLYRGSTLLVDQIFALTAVSVVVTFGVQSFGDMGHLCWLPNVCVAPLLGGVGGRVAALGLWPNVNLRRRPTGVGTTMSAPS